MLNSFKLLKASYAAVLLAIPVVSFCSFGQENLVPNGSFEEHTNCPDGVSQINYVVGWSSFGNTPDYFNFCNNSAPMNMELVGVPKNFCGYQNAATGEAYCGLATWGGDNQNYREFIGCELNTPLDSGVTYYTSMKINFPYREGNPCHNTAIKNMGIRFTNTQYSAPSPHPTDNICHVCVNEFIYDTLNWIHVKGSFTPSQSYRFLMVGNFFTNVDTDTLMLFSPFNCGNCSYYYVDDIIVSTDSSLLNQNIVDFGKVPNIFTPNNDGINDIWKFNASIETHLEIVNRWGNRVYESTGYSFQWEGENCTDGVYYYRIVSNDPEGSGQEVKSGFIQLIR